MKKAVLLLSITLLSVACKNKEAKPQEVPQGIVKKDLAPVLDCSFFDPLNGMTQNEQVRWLKLNEDQACLAQYDQCRENAHKLTQADFNQAVSDYWGEEEVVNTEIKLGDIEALSSQTEYGQYISAQLNSSKNVVLAATNTFTDTPVCFSVPLFYSIQRLHNLTSESILVFTGGKKESKNIIVFYIKGTTDSYDMSNNPM
jgi:hypothetical protein